MAFPGFVQFEVHGMAVSQVFQGNTRLPPYEEQLQWHRDYLDWRADLKRRQKTEASFYTVFMPFPDHMRWLDEASGCDVLKHFGWLSSKAWSFWWSDREMYKLCKSGVFSPAIWRLFEGGKRKAWPGAREQILKDNAAVKRQIEERTEKMASTQKKAL
ncbi:MAG: hypothetical protein INR71_11160 [Terriglobus roseus]|nr:hypothetical protein [Terriglobus roseus]